MEERIDESDHEMDELMLPGFRFHPTDEELVGFYLRRKIQHKPLSIELIKQLDIYKYDPWDLPKMAATGEKEWYFYCPRDRKYRNSPRPNRVTGAGFWKATGTDRPIYSSEGSKVCIGLKKSLVFYKGRAAKGIKTDWMMHEFRLPSASDSLSAKRYLDRNIPANEAWAICRIFKKPNSSAQRGLSHSWVSPLLDANITSSHTINLSPNVDSSQFSSSTMTMANPTTSSPPQVGVYSFMQQSINASFSPKPCPASTNSNSDHQTPNPTPSSTVTSQPKCAAINDASSLLLDMSNSVLGEVSDSVDFSMLHEQRDFGFSSSVSNNMQENYGQGSEEATLVKGQSSAQMEDPMRSLVGFHYGLADVWKWGLLWDSSPCPGEFSAGFSTTNCYR